MVTLYHFIFGDKKINCYMIFVLDLQLFLRRQMVSIMVMVCQATSQSCTLISHPSSINKYKIITLEEELHYQSTVVAAGPSMVKEFGAICLDKLYPQLLLLDHQTLVNFLFSSTLSI